MTAFPTPAPFGAAASALVILAAALAFGGGPDVRLWHAAACDTSQRLLPVRWTDAGRHACVATATAADVRNAMGMAQ